MSSLFPLLAAVALATSVASANEPSRPNFLLIVADDLGAADLGINGSEIRTPNLDRLAREGAFLTNFYTAPNCSPTRAMLLTGVDHHVVGLGSMAESLAPEVRGRPGYEGYLNDRVATVAEVLRGAGYFTAIAGKWHLGHAPDRSPDRKGFERSFVLHDGGASHFEDGAGIIPTVARASYSEDGRKTVLAEEFFSTQTYTDKLIGYVDEGRKKNKPVFLYAAYTAPHFPLQAPPEWLDRYKGAYRDGYEELRARRFAARKALGQVPQETRLPPLPRTVQPWATLTPDRHVS